MKRFLFLLPLLFSLSIMGQAQNVAAGNPQAAGPARPTDKTFIVKTFREGRERTLLGDLDLSGMWGGPTYDYSATGDDWALVRGGFGGLEFGDEFFLGYGGWASHEDFKVDEDPINGPNYEFQHGGLILAYSPGRNRSIHPRFTALLGPGKIDIKGDAIGPDRLLVGQAMAGVELNLFQFMRLGVDAGYRFASGVETDGISDRDVSGALIQIEARFGFSW